MSIARSISRSCYRSLESHAGGGIPRTGLIFYAKAPGMVIEKRVPKELHEIIAQTMEEFIR